jgi:deoxyribonuclease-4
MVFGAHVSVAGGLQNAIAKGQGIGADILQIFVSPPQSFKTTDYSDEQIVEFKRLYQNAGFSGLFFHAIYLINLASENRDLVELSKKSLIHYLQMGDKLGAVGTIVHLGSYKDGNLELLKTQVVTTIKEILAETRLNQKLIVENCAGKKIGKNLDELVEIHERVGSDRLSFCIDTQHLFAWGHGATSENNDFGPVRNPWDATRSAGGSTGGVAAAIAARMECILL